jgi:transposase
MYNLKNIVKKTIFNNKIIFLIFLKKLTQGGQRTQRRGIFLQNAEGGAECGKWLGITG